VTRSDTRRPAAVPTRSGTLTRIRRGLRRRATKLRRRSRRLFRRLARRAVRLWRSSLQIRVGAITMLVAGTVVVIVSLVLFSQIRDQLLRVKREAAIDQAQ
jgi:two-component system, OmpR family, sensor histidine kinase MtrB